MSIPIPAPLVFKTAGAKVDAVAAPSAAPNAVLKVETIISKVQKTCSAGNVQSNLTVILKAKLI